LEVVLLALSEMDQLQVLVKEPLKLFKEILAHGLLLEVLVLPILS
jgi:hypothetical protein